MTATLPAPLRVGSETFDAGSPLSAVQAAIDDWMETVHDAKEGREPWPAECRAEIDALEEKWDIDLCSTGFAGKHWRGYEKAVRERDEWKRAYDQVQAVNSDFGVADKGLMAERDRYKAALEPFADFGEFLLSETTGVSPLDKIELRFEESDVLLDRLYVGAFRRAAEALNPPSHEEKGS